MSARGKPLRLLWAEMNNGLASHVFLPLGNGDLASPHTLKEHVGRPHEPERSLCAKLDLHREMTVLVINDRRFLNECNTVKQSIHSVHSTNPRLPERVDSGALNLNEGNRPPLTEWRCLQAVASKRQTGGTVASRNAVGRTTQPANDNPVNDDWHPLEAA